MWMWRTLKDNGRGWPGLCSANVEFNLKLVERWPFFAFSAETSTFCHRTHTPLPSFWLSPCNGSSRAFPLPPPRAWQSAKILVDSWRDSYQTKDRFYCPGPQVKIIIDVENQSHNITNGRNKNWTISLVFAYFGTEPKLNSTQAEWCKKCVQG